MSISEPGQPFINEFCLHPLLEELVLKEGLDAANLTVGLKYLNNKPDLTCREEIIINAPDKKSVTVKVESLRALFRGDKPAPAIPHEPPPAYMRVFLYLEFHAVTFLRAFGMKTDAEFEEVFTNLRRRPDGKTISPLHFFMWQVAGGLLLQRPLSAAEFEAIFARLARSASTMRQGLVSRNYAATIMNTVGRMQ